jgi:CarboxypepD_reg-like domain
MRIISIFISFLCLNISLFAQNNNPNDEIIEVSGVIVTRNDRGKLEQIPYATILALGTSRGTYANYDGMFSLVIKKGQTLKFSAIGFETVEMTVPKDQPDISQSVVIELQMQAAELNQVVVMPWPNRDNLRAEFLALNPNEALQMQEEARRNLQEQQLMAMQQTFRMDSKDAATYYLQKQARDFSYMGQLPPQAIFDPLAWARFAREQKVKKEKKQKEKKQKNSLD